MTDPNVLSYFLLILGGFGVVWSFRHFTHKNKEKIGEFEYAAFSTLWGIPVFLIFVWGTQSKPELLKDAFNLPMVATPTLFSLGLALGFVGAQIYMGASQLITNKHGK